MIEQEIASKQAELDRIKEEIVRLNSVKSNLVRELNVPLLEADKKAKQIIADAERYAQIVMENSNKIKVDRENSAIQINLEATNLLHIAKAGIGELKIAQNKLKEDTEMLNTLKNQYLVDVKKHTEEKEKAIKDINERQGCLDTLEHTVRSMEVQLKENTNKLKDSECALLAKQDQLRAAQEELNQKVYVYNKDKLEIDSSKESVTKTLAEIKLAQDKIALDNLTIQSQLADISGQYASIAVQKETINAQFALITQNQRELEEQALSLSEREQLLAKKDAEVTQKILILQQLREK